MRRAMLVASSLVELAAGLSFLLVPSEIVSFAGVSLGEFGLLVARIFGVAAIVLGTLCWLASSEVSHRFGRVMGRSMMVYHGAVTSLLGIAVADGVAAGAISKVILVVHLLLTTGLLSFVRSPRVD